jgi:hypothetical protein
MYVCLACCIHDNFECQKRQNHNADLSKTASDMHEYLANEFLEGIIAAAAAQLQIF